MNRALIVAVAGSLGLCSCADIDVHPDVLTAQTLLAETTPTLAQAFAPIAARELRAAEAYLIARGAPILEVSGICNPRLARESGSSFADCRLRTLADPTGQGINASEVQGAVAALVAYWAAIEGLSSAESRGEVDTATARVAAAVQGLAGQSATPAGQAVALSAPILGRALSFGIEAYRTTQLRTLMDRADPIMDDLVAGIAAWIASQPGNELAAYQTFRTAFDAMEAARTSGNTARYAAAIENTRRVFAELQHQQENDPTNALWLIREAHASILLRLNNPTLSETIDTFEALDAIRQLLEGGPD